ncbi:MAG: FtsQ-type POTRA domain-containing protein [Rhodospirillales bacterium]|nr:FtsQ-type POTRA domain-containing protein [Rhodospirillales bacterium]
MKAAGSFVRGAGAPGSGSPRPKVRRALRRKLAAAALALGGFAAAAGGYVLWREGHVEKSAAAGRAALVAAAAEMGFRVDEVLIVGRAETAHADLLAALALARGSPLFAFDADAARKRLEGLPWVHRARVTRMWPSTVVVRIEEREPLALWQHQGRFALIDREGHVILRDRLERFGRLPVVVGEDAPPHAAAILATLASEPELMKRVTAAVRVGGRRWNVRLDGTIDVRLPEDGAGAAWKRLAEYERTQGLLGRDVRTLDLRLPDRLIVRTRGQDKET